MNSTPENCKTLLRHSASVSIKDKQSVTPLREAVDQPNPKNALFLLQNGAEDRRYQLAEPKSNFKLSICFRRNGKELFVDNDDDSQWRDYHCRQLRKSPEQPDS